MKRSKSEAASSLRASKMMSRVNLNAKILASAKTKTMVKVGKSVDVDVDVEKPSFPKGAYDT